ncbi:MAG: arsenate reductase (azurin) small subunit [Thalassovita sp.]|nr:arsenate reductase (azurin) small subunit [Thalassovita sp.]
MSNKCNKLVGIGRRQFMRGGALAAAGATIATASTSPTEAASAAAQLDYPSNRLGNIADLVVNEPMDIEYPDADSPGILLKLGEMVEGGVGPDGDIVAYSVLCPHKGWYLSYNSADKSLNCPRPLLALRRRGRRTTDLGPRHAKPAAIYPADRRQGRHLCRGLQRPDLRSSVQRALRGRNIMAYKRQIDRLPIPPADATVHNVTCHYCIVGCGYPFIEMHEGDMARLGIGAGDLVEIHNENGATQDMAYPTDTAKPGQVAMVFGSPAGSQGNVVNPGVKELVLPYYKHTWGNIRKLANATPQARAVSFKSKEYKA